MRGRRDVVKGKERKGRYERMERYGKRGERERVDVRGNTCKKEKKRKGNSTKRR